MSFPSTKARGGRGGAQKVGVRIQKVEFRENVEAFFPKGQIIKQTVANNKVSVSSGCP